MPIDLSRLTRFLRPGSKSTPVNNKNTRKANKRESITFKEMLRVLRDQEKLQMELNTLARKYNPNANNYDNLRKKPFNNTGKETVGAIINSMKILDSFKLADSIPKRGTLKVLKASEATKKGITTFGEQLGTTFGHATKSASNFASSAFKKARNATRSALKKISNSYADLRGRLPDMKAKALFEELKKMYELDSYKKHTEEDRQEKLDELIKYILSIRGKLLFTKAKAAKLAKDIKEFIDKAEAEIAAAEKAAEEAAEKAAEEAAEKAAENAAEGSTSRSRASSTNSLAQAAAAAMGTSNVRPLPLLVAPPRNTETGEVFNTKGGRRRTRRAPRRR